MLLKNTITLLLGTVISLMPFSAISATKSKKAEEKQLIKQNKTISRAKVVKVKNDIKLTKTTKLSSKTKSVETKSIGKSTKNSASKKVDVKQKASSIKSGAKVVDIKKPVKSTQKGNQAHNKVEKLVTHTSSINNYGVKGAKLTPTKVMDKKYTYRIKGKTHTTIGKTASRTYSQVGVASYYGGKFHGRKTANGEIFNKNAYTAAHKTLALGSYALVTNVRNGRKVIVRINDRGPFSHNRIIDLSVASAKAIGMLHSGVARVKVEAIIVEPSGKISGKGADTLQKIAKKK